MGGDAEPLMSGMLAAFGDASERLGTWVAARSRAAEDWLAASGAEQYVILGAGLDSYAWRQPGAVRVFEVDEPATQAWKRSRLDELGVRHPAELRWVPVDFERESLAAGLARAGLGPGPTFVNWIGVTMYLALDVIEATLRALPPCSLAVSYLTPEDMWHREARDASERFLAMAREAGEPIVSLLAPGELAETLARCGFAVAEDVGPDDVERRYGLPALSICHERTALATKAA